MQKMPIPDSHPTVSGAPRGVSLLRKLGLCKCWHFYTATISYNVPNHLLQSESGRTASQLPQLPPHPRRRRARSQSARHGSRVPEVGRTLRAHVPALSPRQDRGKAPRYGIGRDNLVSSLPARKTLDPVLPKALRN